LGIPWSQTVPTARTQTPNFFVAHATNQQGFLMLAFMLLVITEQTTSGPRGELVQVARPDGKYLIMTIPTRLH
jgi:hypothetical protein